MNATVSVENSAVSAATGTHAVTLAHPIVAADIDLDLIDTQPGFNPRIYFKQTSLEELAESIARRGVVQSIALRPRPDQPGRFWIIAGERRVRAARMAGLKTMPCRIFDVDELDALEIAAAENGPRENLSYGEEARDARRMMRARQGDRAEAARRLGWSVKKFDARLVLSRASEAVLIALAEERIFLGHAELLSPLPEETQNGTLQDIINRKISVEDLRKTIDHFALDLGTARFDKTECQGCLHNTTVQASLLEQHIGAGRCTDRPCFTSKTSQYLSELRVGLRDDHNAVYLDTERDSDTYTLLLRRDVGAAQFDEGCKQCANFGCLLSSQYGSVGKLTQDVCFDLTCHAQKKDAHTQAKLSAAAAADRSTAGSSASAVKQPQSPSTRPKPTTGTADKRPAPAAQSDTKRVQDAVHAIQRRAAGVEVQNDAKMIQVYVVLALLRELGAMHEPLEDDPVKNHGVRRERSGDSRSAMIEPLYNLELSHLNEITADLAARIAASEMTQTQNGVSYLKGMLVTLRVLKVDLTKHFTLDAKFLSAHTKAGIEAVMRQAGFHTHCNRVDQSAFAKLMVRKYDDIIKAIFKSGFDFKGFIPKSLRVPTK